MSEITCFTVLLGHTTPLIKGIWVLLLLLFAWQARLPLRYDYGVSINRHLGVQPGEGVAPLVDVLEECSLFINTSTDGIAPTSVSWSLPEAENRRFTNFGFENAHDFWA